MYMFKVNDIVTYTRNPIQPALKIVDVGTDNNKGWCRVAPLFGIGDVWLPEFHLKPATVKCSYGCTDEKDFIITCKACTSLDNHELQDLRSRD